MKWSFRMGRIAGVNVFLHVTFLLLLGFIAVAEGLSSGSIVVALYSLLFFIALFACVLAHEFGHILMARRFGIPTRDVTLLPIGGVARLERLPDRPMNELWIALAGPAVNLVIAIVLTLWILANPIPGTSVFDLGFDGGFASGLLTVNIAMLVFNLIPAFPMDGGRVLRALLALRIDFLKATRIAATLGKVLAVVFVGVGLLAIGNPFLVFIAVMVWFGANQELQYAIIKSSFRIEPLDLHIEEKVDEDS